LVEADTDDVFTPELGVGGTGDNEAGVVAVTGVGEASCSRSLSRSKNTGPDLVMLDVPGIVEIEGRGVITDVGEPPNLRLSLGDKGLEPTLGALGE